MVSKTTYQYKTGYKSIDHIVNLDIFRIIKENFLDDKQLFVIVTSNKKENGILMVDNELIGQFKKDDNLTLLGRPFTKEAWVASNQIWQSDTHFFIVPELGTVPSFFHKVTMRTFNLKKLDKITADIKKILEYKTCRVKITRFTKKEKKLRCKINDFLTEDQIRKNFQKLNELAIQKAEEETLKSLDEKFEFDLEKINELNKVKCDNVCQDVDISEAMKGLGS